MAPEKKKKDPTPHRYSEKERAMQSQARRDIYQRMITDFYRMNDLEDKPSPKSKPGGRANYVRPLLGTGQENHFEWHGKMLPKYGQ